MGGILSRQYRPFEIICAFLVHINQVTHFGTVSYLFACLKWQMICVWWELFECKLTPLHFVGLDNKRSETTLEWSLPLRTSCTTSAAAVACSCLPATHLIDPTIEGVSGFAFAFQLQSFSLEFSYKAKVALVKLYKDERQVAALNSQFMTKSRRRGRAATPIMVIRNRLAVAHIHMLVQRL